MSYFYYPQAGCEQAVLEHFCDDCGKIEGARVRSVAFIHESFTFTNKEDPTEWMAGILAKKILVINKTQGSFDGGSPKEAPGFGDQLVRTIGSDYVLQFKDPNYKENRVFYNELKRSRSYSVAFRTETQTHYSNVAVNVEVKNPIADDLNADVLWDVTSKWSSQELTEILDTPLGIFERCIAIAA